MLEWVVEVGLRDFLRVINCERRGEKVEGRIRGGVFV